jgi:hypothetical protein
MNNWETFRKEVNTYEFERINNNSKLKQTLEAQIRLKKVIIDELLKGMTWNAIITGLIACEIDITNAPTQERDMPEFLLKIFSIPNSNFLKFLEIAIYSNQNMKKFEGK